MKTTAKIEGWVRFSVGEYPLGDGIKFEKVLKYSHAVGQHNG